MPNSERIETLISPEAIKQFEQLKSATDANTASFEKLIAKAVELNKAVGNATTFKEITKATKDMADNESALTKQVDELAKANAKLQTLYEQQAQKIKDLQEKKKKASDDERKGADDVSKAQDKLNKSYSDEAKTIAGLKDKQQARNQALKEEAQLSASSEGSIKQKQILLKQLQRDYDNLSQSERDASTGTDLLAGIQELDKELKGLEGTTGRFQRNVGNYGSALKTLEGYLADVRTQLSATKQAANGLTLSPRGGPGPSARNNSAPLRTGDNTQQLVKYNQALTQSADKVEDLQKQEQLLSRIVESQIAGYASATAELKSNEKALQSLAAAGLQSTEFYQVLLKDTAELKDSVGDLKDEIKALSSDTRNIDLVAGAVTGLVSAFQVGASAAELLTSGNEDIQKSIQRLTALQNIAQGIQQLSNDLTTKGTALNKLYNFIIGEGTAIKEVNTVATVENTVATEATTIATEGAAVATEGLSIAMKVLRGAIAASGVGLLIVGIVYLIGKIQEWSQADLNLIKQQAELNGVILETIRLNKELEELTRTDIGTTIQALKNKIAANQAYGRSQGEVLAAELKLAEARRDAATFKFFDTGGAKALGDLETQLNDAASAYRQFIEQQANTPINQRGNKEQSDAQKALLQSNLDLLKEKVGEQKKVVEDYVGFNNDLTSKQLEIDRLSADERRKFTLESATLTANGIIEANQRALDNERATLDQRIALIKSSSEQQKVLARAQNQNVQNDPSASGTDRILAANNLQASLNKIELDGRQLQFKIREEYRKRDLSADLEILKTKLDDAAKANDLIADNEKKSFDERTNALYASFENRRSIIIAQYQYELQAAGLTATERIAIEQKYLSDVNALTVEYGQHQIQVYQQNQDKVNEIIEKGQKARQDKIAGDAAAADTELIKQLVSGQITLEQYNRQREMADSSARVQSLKEEVNNATAKVLATKEGTVERFEAEKELREKTLALNEEYNKKEIDAITKLNDLKKELATEAVETFNALVNDQFDNESAKVQQAIDDLDRQKEKDIEVANATIANKAERELAIATIEKKAQVQREQLDKRQRQIDLDRARFEKASNIAQIISTTAVAIIKTFKDYPAAQALPLSIAIGALGALQLAKAIAAPLPKFAEGTTDAPGGPSWVGDGYKKELVITPQGQVMQTPSVPTVMNVPKHSIVLPDARAALESGLAVNRQGRLVHHDNSNVKIEQKLDTIAKAIKNKPVLNMNANESGLTAIWNYGANQTSYIEDQTRF